MHILTCQLCKNQINMNLCLAFPDGIPDKILVGEHDHEKPYKGDNDIQFEPIEDNE